MIGSRQLPQIQPPEGKEGTIAPIALSIIGIIVWLVFILLFALYWSNGFSLFQNVIVTIVSFAIMGLLIGLVWVVWGGKRVWRETW